MTQHRFQRGTEILFRDRPFIVEGRVEDDKIQIRDLRSNEYTVFPEKDLVDALFEKQLTFVTQSPSNGGKYADDLALIPEAKVAVAKRRLRYVQECINKRVELSGAKWLQPIIELVAKEIQDPTPPSWASLFRWTCLYEKSDRDIRSLLPQNRRGNQKRKFGTKSGTPQTGAQEERTADVVRIVDEVIKQRYLDRQRLSVQAVYEYIESRIHDENKYRAPHNQLPMPHISSIHDIVAGMSNYEKDRARLGKREADQIHKQRGIGIRPSRCLERVEIDHTKVDGIVVDDQSLIPLGRPWVTTALDKGTGMPLGRFIGFEPPGSNSVFQCLLHAIRPKTYLRETFPNIQNDWEAYGLPESIASDNGMEFLGKHYREACMQLGITIDYMPVRQPWFKSSIERFFRTHNTKLIHRLPGTTFSNIFDKGDDYDPAKHAIIRFSTFVELYDTWIVDVFSREKHRGFEVTGPKNIPALAWKEGIEEWPPSLPPSDVDLDILLRMIEHRTIQHGGIELFGIRYNDPKLALLRQELKGEKVMVKYDSSNLAMIYVADVRNGTYIPVPALATDYASGLSVYQHQVIQRYRRNYLNGAENSSSLIEAKKRIREIVESELRYSKSLKTNTRAARFLKIDSKPENLTKKGVAQKASQANGDQPIPRLLPADVPSPPMGTVLSTTPGNSLNGEIVADVPSIISDVKESGRPDDGIIGSDAEIPGEALDVDHDDELDDGEWSASHDLPVRGKHYETYD